MLPCFDKHNRKFSKIPHFSKHFISTHISDK
uniref:Uncharacterized protein n=1 Tax=Arundo donax TaxID=35708 RepID=A0A0A9GNG8_ARUDO